ncbi:hypothetical protein TR80_009750 [Xanthomonas campestris]|uniref:hypothetical protein n=1 Tax=Xanthomonas campestris TaxID=339 RepID=UPI0011AF0050|nr:hypothetical protein [Xanthomonas campestris]TXD43128.1 hypothetical protein TR80_009750 [Xanthomonas campestris]
MDPVWGGLIAAVIGGVSGAAGGAVANKWTNKVNRTAARLEKRLDDTESAAVALRIEAISYWTTRSDDEQAGHRIIGLWESLVSHLTAVQELCASENVESASECADRLYELTTGGNFQGKNREAEPGRRVEIRRACDELCTLIRGVKPKLRQ